MMTVKKNVPILNGSFFFSKILLSFLLLAVTRRKLLKESDENFLQFEYNETKFQPNCFLLYSLRKFSSQHLNKAKENNVTGRKRRKRKENSNLERARAFYRIYSLVRVAIIWRPRNNQPTTKWKWLRHSKRIKVTSLL